MQRTTVSMLLALGLVLAACGAEDEVAVDDLDDEVETQQPEESEEPDEEPEEVPDPEPEDPEAQEDDAPEPDDEAVDEPTEEPDDEPGPQPDPARVDDPCAERDEDEIEAFLDVVSPVDGQEVLDSVDLVGCSSVPEGTVRYRVLADDGGTLVDDFTTATAGGPDIGEYSEVIGLDEVGDEADTVTVEVFWDSPAGDGGEEDLTSLELHLE